MVLSKTQMKCNIFESLASGGKAVTAVEKVWPALTYSTLQLQLIFYPGSNESVHFPVRNEVPHLGQKTQRVKFTSKSLHAIVTGLKNMAILCLYLIGYQEMLRLVVVGSPLMIFVRPAHNCLTLSHTKSRILFRASGRCQRWMYWLSNHVVVSMTCLYCPVILL